jgi:ATP-binding cassette, subfamily B, bacterial
MEKISGQQFSFGYLISLMSKFKSGIFLVIVLNILWTVLQICIPFLTKALVDNGIQNRDIDIVWAILLAQVLLFIGITIADLFRKWVLRHIGVRVSLQMVLNFLNGIIKKPFSFFNVNEQGRTIQHFNDNLRIETFLTNNTSDFFNALLKIITFGILLFIFNSQIGLIFIGFNLLLVIWISFFLKTREAMDEQQFKLSALVRTELIEIFTGIIDLKAYNQEKNRIASWDKVQSNFSDIRLNLLRISQQIFGGVNSLSQMRDILILFVAAKATIEGNMTLGTLIAIQYILGQLTIPVKEMIDFVPQYQDAKLSLNRINTALASVNLENEKAVGIRIPQKADIHIHNLEYSYLGQKLALNNISIEVPFGKSIAILGESGSGKSTLLKLILKLLVSTKGEINIGNIPLNTIKAEDWISHCSVVMQESMLFQKSILYNVTFEQDLDKIDLDRVYQCLKSCEIIEAIEALPLGMQSIVGHDGVNFSKGQAQRILLARSLYKEVDYYFLDEPFSALDRLTYLKVFKNMRDQLHDKTLLIVTHKMEVASKMDYIYLLEDGVLIESGTHEKLAALGQRYFNIFLSDEE